MNILFLFFIFLLPAVAQEHPPSCKEDAKRLCSDKESSRDKLDCLTLKLHELSDECKRELQRLSQILKDTGSSRSSGTFPPQGGPLSGMGLIPPSRRLFSIGGTLAPEKTSTNQLRVNAATPVWSEGNHSTALSLNMQRLEIGEKKAPRQLDRAEVSGMYSRKLPDSRMMGGRLQLGSASDRPFHSDREISFTLSAFYLKPAKESHYWLYSVFLSNNNPIANFIPIPGVTYAYQGKNFTGLFGFPINSFQWTPISHWSYSFSFFITNMNFEVTYGLKDEVQFSAGFARSQQTFLLHERENIRDRLFFSENRIFAGIKNPLQKMTVLDLQGGLSFDRQLREGQRFNQTDLLLNAQRSWYLSANLNFLF